MSTHCNVCGAALGNPIYRSAGRSSITSLCEVWPETTEVHFCSRCTHVQTTEPPNVSTYYDQSYKILIDSEEEDQIYQVVDGKPVYRTDHQLAVMLAKLPIPRSAHVLDYGCAKSSTLRKLVQARPDVEPHLFDVSEMYTRFWATFAKPENWAVYEPRAEWSGHFDVVTSFYSLEHMTNPQQALSRIFTMLRPGGFFYCVVPDLFGNVADLVVVDHVNHYTGVSLRVLLGAAGFEQISIDGESHQGAMIAVARRPRESQVTARSAPAEHEIGLLGARVAEVARYWQDANSRVRAFEIHHGAVSAAAIYGSGFYGTFIFTCLDQPQRIACFIDQNPFRQGKRLLDKPILAPAELDRSISLVYVGLNPGIARANIAAVPGWQDRNHRYFFL